MREPGTFLLVTGFNGLVFLLEGKDPMLKSYLGDEVVLTGIPTPSPAPIKPGGFPGTSVLDFEVEPVPAAGAA